MPIQSLRAEPTTIDGLWVLRMKAVEDDRGAVREFYRASALGEAGPPTPGPWVQVNLTETRQGVVRGLHGESMHKLVAIATGVAFGAYVDVRPGSPTWGTTVTQPLVPGVQVFVPPGVCNGFQSVSPGLTQYLYCFDQEWRPDMPGTSVHPLDPELAIPWPIPLDEDGGSLSAKDAALPTLAELASAGTSPVRSSTSS